MNKAVSLLKGLITKKTLYAFCFLILCIVNQRTQTYYWASGAYEIFRDLIGVVFAVIIFSHYKKDDYNGRFVPYIVNLILCLLSGPIIFYVQSQREWHVNHLLENAIITLIVIMYGHIFMHIYFDIFVDRNTIHFNKKIFIPFFLMIVWMIISKSDETWPFFYMIMFGSFILTGFEKNECENMWNGACNGIIVSFFLIQGFAAAFRPFDRARYVGAFNNSNNTALYFAIVIAACLVKLFGSIKEERKFCIWLYVVVCGGAIACLTLTQGRSGILTAICLIILMLILLFIYTKKIMVVLKYGFIFLLTTIVMIPLCYGIVRFTPVLFHHPIFFFGEPWQDMVQSSDPWDSEKYTSFEEIFSSLLKRVGIVSSETNGEEENGQGSDNIDDSEAIAGKSSLEYWVSQGIGEEQYNEALYKSSEEFGEARIPIYKYFIQHLNLLGHCEDDIGFQFLPNYYVGHAHNIFLQYATQFGVIILLFLIPLLIITSISNLKIFVKTYSTSSYCVLNFMLVSVIFGMFEFCWGTTILAQLLLYFVFSTSVLTFNNCQGVDASE